MTDLDVGAPTGAASAIRSSLRAQLPAGALHGSRVLVAISPLATVGLLTYDAVQGRTQLGTPDVLRRAIRARLDRHDREVLAVLERSTAPACLVGASIASAASIATVVCGPPVAGRSFDDAVESLAASAPEAIFRALGADPDGAAPARLASDPPRWARRYAVALRHAWSEVEPLWRRARVLFDREAERVHAAAERGNAPDLVAALRVTAITEPHSWSGRVMPRITVCPTLAGRRATVILADERGDPRALYYPIPNAWRAINGVLPPAVALEALIGRAHAAVLQRLDRPATVDRVAAVLSLSPGTVKLQLQRLERAGLVAQAPGDASGVVERTARGTLLLSLYDRD